MTGQELKNTTLFAHYTSCSDSTFTWVSSTKVMSSNGLQTFYFGSSSFLKSNIYYRLILFQGPASKIQYVNKSGTVSY
jgi:hypothetical protein